MADRATNACVVCGARNHFSFMEVENTHGARRLSSESEKFDLVKCASCGMVRIEPMPPPEEIWRYYDTDYYCSGSRIKRYLERALGCRNNLSNRRLITRFHRGGRLLDVGCARGEFLNIFDSTAWDLYGVEPNKEGYAQNVARGYARIFDQDLIACAFQSDYFDVITMWHVFEHVHSPNRQLQEIHRILKDHGLLIIEVPNIEGMGFKLGGKHWFHLDCPRHLYHYNPGTIRRMLKNNGLNAVKIYYPVIGFPLDVFHSLGNSIEDTMLRRLLMPVLIMASMVFKLIGPALRASETMIIVCTKSGLPK